MLFSEAKIGHQGPFQVFKGLNLYLKVSIYLNISIKEIMNIYYSICGPCCKALASIKYLQL